MKPREYATPAAFKAALDQRLRNVAEPGGIARRRQLLVFDRYLARLVRVLGDAATLKGGLVLELRLDRARTTRDIDLRLVGSPGGLLARLQEAGRLDLGDFMSFEVRVDARHPDIAGPGVQYEGQRFRAECRLAGMLYGQTFGVDVAFGDPIFGEPELITGDDLLAFAGIAAPELRVYPVETHVAEKLHAYTLPRETPSTRVKDLPDLALLGQRGTRGGSELRWSRPSGSAPRILRHGACRILRQTGGSRTRRSPRKMRSPGPRSATSWRRPEDSSIPCSARTPTGAGIQGRGPGTSPRM